MESGKKSRLRWFMVRRSSILASLGLIAFSIGAVRFACDQGARHDVLMLTKLEIGCFPDVITATHRVSTPREAQALVRALLAWSKAMLTSKDYNLADKELKKAEPILYDAFGDKSKVYWMFLCTKAYLADKHNQPTAEGLLRHALDESPKSIPEELSVFTLLLRDRLAWRLRNKDDFAAEIFLREQNASDLDKLAKADSRCFAVRENNYEGLGFAYQFQHNYPLAKQNFSALAALIDKREGHHSWRYGECLMEIGRVELRLNDYSDAENHLKEAQYLFQTTHSNRWSPSHERESAVLTDKLLAQAEKKFNLPSSRLPEAL